MRSTTTLVAAAALLSVLGGPGLGHAGEQGEFRFDEATIADVHRAMINGQITARQLVLQSMRRIEAFDKTGPEIKVNRCRFVLPTRSNNRPGTACHRLPSIDHPH